MIKVIFSHLVTDYGGGSDRSMFEMVSALKEDCELKISVLLNENDPKIIEYEAGGVEVIKVKTHPVNKRDLAAPVWAVWKMISGILEVRKILKKERPLIFHVNTAFNLQSGISAYLTRGVTLVWHVRENLHGGKINAVIRFAIIRMSSRVLVISKYVGSAFKPTEKLRQLYNIISPPERSLGGELERDCFVVASLARVEPWKGIDIIPEIAYWSNKRAEKPIVYKIYGATPEKDRSYLFSIEKKIEELGVGKYVKFKGPINEPWDALAEADIVLLPNRIPEPFGRVMVEAMLSERPVIAFNFGGAAEIIENYLTGILVRPGDTLGMADAVVNLLKNSKERTRIRRAGKNFAAKTFIPSTVAMELKKIYAEAASNV